MSELQTHMETNHAGAKPFACNICGKEFSRRSSLNEHAASHKEDANDKINEEASQTSPETAQVQVKQEPQDEPPVEAIKLPQHTPGMNLAHLDNSFLENGISFKVSFLGSDREKKYTCQTCNKSFYNKRMFKRHERKHTSMGSRVYSCSQCDYKTHEKGLVMLHARSHEKPFHCATCGKGFTRKSTLSYHEKTHDVAQPTMMETRLRQSPGGDNNTRKLYQMIADNQRALEQDNTPMEISSDYKCTTCGAVFSSVQSWKRHSLVHSGERKFICGVCDWRFAQRSNLKRHMMNVHK